MSKQSTPVRLAGLAAILISLAAPVALPPPARAADAGPTPDLPAGGPEFYVDRPDDTNANACTSANPNDCTLRGAINRINTDGVVNATIRFSSTLTQIDLTAALPALTTVGTAIFGILRVSGSGMASGAMLTIDTSNARVEGLSFVNGIGTDIRVLSGSGNIIRQNNIGTPSDAVDTCVSAGVTRTSAVGIYVGPAVAGSIATPAVWISENTISCHATYGIQADGADGLAIGIGLIPSAGPSKNYIGTNYQSDILGNGIGIALLANGSNGARYSQIRDNWIWNSALDGVWLYGTGTNNLNSTASNAITGNSIRDNGRSGSASGIRLQNGAYYNGIGGAAAGDRNRIERNNGDGIRIESSNGNGILGNWIGLSPSSNNTGNGIRIDAGEDNWIGGLALVAAAGNEIGGNDLDGIRLTNGSRKTTITRNLIGSDQYGTPRPNGVNGISILSGSYSTTIGTGIVDDLNVIAGNALHGLLIGGATTTSNTVRLNDIGLNSNSASGCGSPPCRVAAPNGGFGVVVQSGAHHNQIYGGNYTAHNGSGGVWAVGGAHDNQFGPNDEVFANAGSGLLFSDAQWNLVTSLRVYSNTRDGIEQTTAGSNNSWINTATHSNGGLGIDIATSADDNIPTAGYPVITSIQRAGGIVTLTGTSDANNPGFPIYNTTTVYVFRDGLDPSGYGEGRTLIGSAGTNAGGVWRVVYAEGATPLCYAAYKRSVGSNGLPYDNGSEFSLSTCIPKKAYVPRVVR